MNCINDFYQWLQDFPFSVAMAFLAVLYTCLQWRTAEITRRYELSKIYLEYYRRFLEVTSPINATARVDSENLRDVALLKHEAEMVLEKDLVKELAEFQDKVGKLYVLQNSRESIENIYEKERDLLVQVIDSKIHEKFRRYTYVPYKVSIFG